MAAKKTVSKGSLLLAQPFMEDPNFKRSAIGITEHGKEGTVGFILNKPIPLKLEELVSEIDTEEKYKIYFGGPVGSDTIHYIHNVGDLLEESMLISRGLWWGGNFSKLIFLINKGMIRRENIRFYIGYSGWSEGQLEDELQFNSWIVSDWFANYTFKSHPNKLWSQALTNKGDHFSVIGQIPPYTNDN